MDAAQPDDLLLTGEGQGMKLCLFSFSHNKSLTTLDQGNTLLSRFLLMKCL